MKLAIIASLIASAAAFAPARQAASSTSLFSYENELGVLPPVGFFDPLGLSEGIDQETFDLYREAELKHGRVAQLAVLGYVAAETYRFPFDIAPGLPCSEVPNGIAAVDAIPALGWFQIIFFIGAVDYRGFLGSFPSGMKAVGGKDLEELKVNELQHGRLAMLAFLELLRHDSQNLVSPGFDGMDKMITGLPFIYN